MSSQTHDGHHINNEHTANITEQVKLHPMGTQICVIPSADTNVLTGRYRLSTKQPIIGQYQLSVHL